MSVLEVGGGIEVLASGEHLGDGQLWRLVWDQACGFEDLGLAEMVVVIDQFFRVFWQVLLFFNDEHLMA